MYDAEVSRAYIDVFKGPLPPLTDEQKAAKTTRTTQDILADYRTKARRKGKETQDEADEQDDNEAEQEDDDDNDEPDPESDEGKG